MQNTPPEPVLNEDLLSGFARLTEDGASELDAALLVAQVIDDHLDTQQTRTRVVELAETARADGVDGVDALLSFLAGQGFGQSALMRSHAQQYRLVVAATSGLYDCRSRADYVGSGVGYAGAWRELSRHFYGVTMSSLIPSA